jgi:hypothetical protein
VLTEKLGQRFADLPLVGCAPHGASRVAQEGRRFAWDRIERVPRISSYFGGSLHVSVQWRRAGPA